MSSLISELAPVNVLDWVREHENLGPRPPMSHSRIWCNGFLVLLFDGPTPKNRADFHINSSPEWFYQLVGDMRCRILENGQFIDFTVGPGQMFLIPPQLPHLNQRDEGSLGIVIHQQRAPGATDAIVWYCEKCCTQLYRADYVCEDLQAQLPIHIRRFLSDEKLRTCTNCGTVMAADRGFM